MHWLLQTNLYSEEGWDTLVTALTRRELSFSVHKVVPFVGALDPNPGDLKGRVIVMGSYSLARYAQAQGWVPGSYLANLDFAVQLPWWGERMLNHDAQVLRFADVPFQPRPFFLRPVLDTKSFTGQVFDWAEFALFRDRVLALSPDDNPTITSDTLVMVCAKKEIYSETRTWIVDGRVVTASGYKQGTLKRYSPPEAVDERITSFAQDCARHWSPNEAYVLDVADTPEGLRICEINNLNSAGFYKGDVGRLVEALEDLNAGKA